MTTVIMQAYRPAPVYVAMKDANNDGWIVTEGDHVGAPIVALTTCEVFARAIAQALNTGRNLALQHIGPVFVNINRPGGALLN